MSTWDKLGKFVFGAAVGGAVGAFIGMLLAPRSGEETRKLLQEDISKRYDASVTTVKNKAQQSMDTLSERAKNLSSELETLGRQTVGKLKGEGSNP